MRTARELAADLRSDDTAVRLRAAEALAQLGEDASPAAVTLVTAAGDPDEEVLEWAAAALESMGPPDPADAITITPLLQSGDGDVGYWAATLLGRLEANGAEAVPALIEALDTSPVANTRHRAAWALGRIGPAATAAAPALQRAMDSDDSRLARLAKASLDKIS